MSNSSWANYGYLVAFEIADNLKDEIARLNQSFGIGVIIINANPYQSNVLFPARYNELDIKTIDKLCNLNTDFKDFFDNITDILNADDKSSSIYLGQLKKNSDKILKSDEDIQKHCIDNNIPLDDKNDDI